MTTMLRKLFGPPAVTCTERDLLDTVPDSAIPNPKVLRDRLVRLTQQINSAEREWELLNRRGDAPAFLALTPIAERLQALRAEAAGLPQQIEAAERRGAAFLALVRLFEAIAAEVTTRVSLLMEHPSMDARERSAELRALDQATRIHGRLAARLRAISASPQFRDPADALKVLRNDLEARIRELDRLRVPGMKPALAWPPQVLELLDVTEERTTSRKETT